MLHAIIHDMPTKLWCGPAAYSVLTGYPTSRFNEELRRERGARGRTGAIMRIQSPELLRALRRAGKQFETLVCGTPPRTLAASERDLLDSAAGRPVLVRVKGHLFVIEGRWMIDNGTRDAIRLKDSPHRRKRVLNAWAIADQPALAV